jgi:hypothetical protein
MLADPYLPEQWKDTILDARHTGIDVLRKNMFSDCEDIKLAALSESRLRSSRQSAPKRHDCCEAEAHHVIQDHLVSFVHLCTTTVTVQCELSYPLLLPRTPWLQAKLCHVGSGRADLYEGPSRVMTLNCCPRVMGKK